MTPSALQNTDTQHKHASTRRGQPPRNQVVSTEQGCRCLNFGRQTRQDLCAGRHRSDAPGTLCRMNTAASRRIAPLDLILN